MSEIARRTKYHRPMVYKLLTSLESEGYIEKSFLEGKRFYYRTTDPSRLREKLSELTKLAEHLIPEMEELHLKNHTAPILSTRE